MAFDKASVRSFDADGRLHVAKTPISKANVCRYMGAEIPNWQSLGLDEKTIYRLWRHPDELEKAAPTFNRIQLMQKHVKVGADEPMKEDVVGTLGSDAEFKFPYLYNSLTVWDAAAIAGVESDEIEELSSAYRYDADMTAGKTPEGEEYDGIMRNIIGNHVAIVEFGRAGSDVVVADADPFVAPTKTTVKETMMKKTKLGTALLVALSAASTKLAQDSALPSVVGGAVKGKFDVKAAKAKIIAMDEDLPVEKVDEIVDALLDVEQTPEPQEPLAVGDEDDGGAPSKHAEIIDFLKSKGLDASDLEAVGNMLTRLTQPQGEDEDDEKVSKADVDTAMDGLRGTLLTQFRDLDNAKQAVRSVVGNVIGMDSAEQVYRFALDHLNIDHKDMPAAGLGKLFAVASERKHNTNNPRIAQDSTSIEKRIPGLSRLS